MTFNWIDGEMSIKKIYISIASKFTYYN